MIELPKAISQRLASEIRQLEVDHARLKRSHEQTLKAKGKVEEDYQALVDGYCGIWGGKVKDVQAFACAIAEAYTMGRSFEAVVDEHLGRKPAG